MDKDFHFGTIYVLSRWSGFNSYNSLVIASASQFVDDNTDNVSMGRRASGHELWENMAHAKENNNIWVPFHFLPGLDTTNPLICKKNSDLAQNMMDDLPEVKVNDSVSMFRLGIALHVYADTWAQQEFSGNISPCNNINNVFPPLQQIEKSADNVNPIPLGHMEAYHYPDRPYLNWKCTPQFPEGRNNYDEFIDASRKIYSFLTKIYSETNSSSEVTGEQESTLLTTFKSICDENIEKRTSDWVNYIHTNKFKFVDFPGKDDTTGIDDTKIKYDMGFISDDDEFSLQFYSALEAHYNWAKTNLEINNQDILTDTNILDEPV
jgi:dTDP-D-glucose 4,6-dehydratase